MKIDQMMELSGILGEGFFADRVFNDKDFEQAKLYVKDVVRARREMMNMTFGDDCMKRLHRLNRFYAWLHKTYGNCEVPNKESAEKFLLKKLEAIGLDTPDFVSFWSYLRKITLSEGSNILYNEME